MANLARAPKSVRHLDLVKGICSFVRLKSPLAAHVLHQQLGLPSVSTLDKHIALHRFSIQFGRDEAIFKQLSMVYRPLLMKMGIIPGSVPVLFSEDETAITACVEILSYNAAASTCLLAGFCGQDWQQGADGIWVPTSHACMSAPLEFSTLRSMPFSRLQDIFKSCRIGHCTCW